MTLLFVPGILSGCSQDSKEIDDQVYVIALGADKGVENKVRVTIQYPTYKESSGGGGASSGMQKGGGGGGGGDEKAGIIDGTVVQTVEAASILEAINLFNTFTSREISLVHVKEIILSEDFARGGIGIYLEPLARFRETRRIMVLAVCKGSAEEYIKDNKTAIGQSLAKAMELMSTQSDNNGYFPKARFQDFYRRITSPYGQSFAQYVGMNNYDHLKPLSEAPTSSPLKTHAELLPGEIPRKGNTKREIIGTAVFDGDRMVGTLNAIETRYLLMVTGKFVRGILTLEDINSPGSVIPFDIRQGRKPVIKVAFKNEIPIINVKLNIEADIGAIQSRIPYEKVNRLDELNNQLAASIKDGVKSVIEKTQKEWNTDIFSFGYYAASHFFTIQKFEKYNWLKHYKDAQVNVEVLANVRRTGLMTESSPIRYNNNTIITGEK
jgi:spore germination protein KC